MLSEELPDRITPMPTCAINIKPDGVTAKPAIEVLQHLEKTLSVAAFGLDHACTAQKRSHPSRNIQTLLMLAGRRDLQPLSNKCPAAAKPRMQGKAAFVLKNNGFLRTQRFEFFLGPWRISSHRLLLPGDKHGRHALTDTRVDASSTGLDGPSALSRTVAVNGSPRWGHPIGHGLIRTSVETPPGEVLTELRPSVSSELDGLAAFSGPGLLRRPYLPPASSGLHSSGSGPELPRSTPVVVPPVSKGGWLSLCRSRLLAPSRRGPAIVLWTPFRSLRGKFSCPQNIINTN
jgi:hypothetical protein